MADANVVDVVALLIQLLLIIEYDGGGCGRNDNNSYDGGMVNPSNCAKIKSVR